MTTEPEAANKIVTYWSNGVEVTGPEFLDAPVRELNLDVRARRCMTKLGINTIGDLVRHTAEDLLECRNFGVTSLKYLRERLAEYNLKLRGE